MLRGLIELPDKTTSDWNCLENQGLVMRRQAVCIPHLSCLAIFILGVVCFAAPPALSLRLEQLTDGKKHHFFGYIGQCQTIPWCGAGRYILALEIDEIAITSCIVVSKHFMSPDEMFQCMRNYECILNII